MSATHLRQVFAYRRPAAPRWPVAAKAATAGAIPLLVGGLLGHLAVAFMASIGAFTVLYGPASPIRYRLSLKSAVASSLVVCAALGTLTAGHAFWAIGAMAVVGFLATFLCNALVVGPPGAYFFVLVVGVAGMIAGHGIPSGQVIGMSAVGALCGLVVGMSDLLFGLHAPERRALTAAEVAVERYETSEAGAEEGPRAAASTSLHAAWTAVRDGGSVPELVARAVRVEDRFVATTARLTHQSLGLAPHPWGEVTGEDDSDERDAGQREAERELAPAHDDRELVRDSSLGRPSPLRLLRNAARWPGEKPLLVARTVVALVVAGTIATYLGDGHAYWAAGAAALILHQGGTRVAQTHRGIQRFVGTLAGLVVFVVLHTVVHELWLTAVIVVAMQFAVELLVVRSYALAVVLITPLALTIGSAGGAAAPVPMAVDRAMDTTIGVAVALAILWLSGRGTAVPFLRAGARRVVDAVRAVLLDLEHGRVDTPAAIENRRSLYLELIWSDDVARRALVDEPEAVRPYRSMERAVSELGYLVLGLCWLPAGAHDPQIYSAARTPLDRIRATSVRRHRPADEIAADVEEVVAGLRAADATR